jgi:hypothetical protein
MQQGSARKILAASFATPDGGSRAGGALGGAMQDKIGNTAVLFVRPDGKAKFVESKDWGAGRGALVGGAIGIIAGRSESWLAARSVPSSRSCGIPASRTTSSSNSASRCSRTPRRSWWRSPPMRSTQRSRCWSRWAPRISSSKTSTRALLRSLRRTRSLRRSPSQPRSRVSHRARAKCMASSERGFASLPWPLSLSLSLGLAKQRAERPQRDAALPLRMGAHLPLADGLPRLRTKITSLRAS